MPIVEQVGRAWTIVAVAAWLLVFVAMCRELLRSVLSTQRHTPAGRATLRSGG